MSYRIAINGFGRIGRNFLRALLDKDLSNAGFQVVAINDLYDTGTASRRWSRCCTRRSGSSTAT